MSIPTDNINICFVGGVSTGKSTALNSVFSKKLTQCHFKRTTMVPTVYIENQTDISDSDQIYETILRKNQEIIQKTETGKTVPKDDYTELVFNVGKLDINIIENSFVNVYDIPGLNDPRTKATYYEYLDTNFHKFNIIVFFIDIRSGLNTSDEFDILDFITTGTRNQIKVNGREVFTLVVVNKADDMQLNVDNDQVVVTGELKEMFEHVEHTVSEEFKRKEIDKQLIGIIPLCALDAYLYRMVQKFGRNFKLTPEQILKIGVNENGKKFSTNTPEEQEKKVYAILQDSTFIETMIKLSGFSQFEKMLQRFLVSANAGKKIRIDNILYELRKLPAITRETFDTYSTIESYMTIYSRIRTIDEDVFHTHVKEFVAVVIRVFTAKLDQINLVKKLVEYYDEFVDSIIRPFFSEYYNVTQYSLYIKVCVKALLLKAFDNSMTDREIIQNFEILKRVGMFNSENICELFRCLCANPRLQHTITSFENPIGIIQLLRDVPSIVDPSKVLRFIIINQLALETCQRRFYIRYLIYRKYGDIPLADYIHGQMQRPTVQMVVDGLSEDDLRDPAYMLDMFYLNRFS